MARIDGSVLVQIKLQMDNLLKDLKLANSIIDDFAKVGEKSIKEFSNKTNDLKQAERNFDKTSESTDRLKTSTVLMANLATEVIKKIISSSINLTKQILTMGISYESAFAGVIKTVNGTQKELDGLRNSFIEMSKTMPITADELAKIGESAGQLGIKTRNIKEFVKTMSDLSNSTNLTSEQASTDLARLANITQMNQKHFGNLGSSIVALGNNFATTESEIVSMALNIAGAGKQVGLTEPQMLATATALSSVGIEAQAGGTAISTMLIEMKKAVTTGEGLNAFAKTANLSIDEFSRLFKTDASQALNAFIRGLGTAQDRGQDALLLLDDLGISETRLTKALLSLGGANNVLNDALKVSNQAWLENTALTKEAEQRYNTMESKIKIAQNGLRSIAITMYDEFKGNFKDGLNEVIDGIDDLESEISRPDMKNALKELSKDITIFLKNSIEIGKKGLPILIKGVSWFLNNGSKIAVMFGSTILINKTAKAYDGITTALRLAKNAQENATIAQKVLNLVMNANPYVLMASAMIALGTAFVIFSKHSNAISEKFKKLNKEIERGKEKTQELRKSLKDSITDISVNTQEWSRLKDEILNQLDINGELIGDKEKLKSKIDELNKSLGETVYFYNEETGKIVNQKGEVVNLKNELSQLIELKKAEAFLEAIKDEYIESLKLQNEQRERQKEALILINEELEKEFTNGKKAKKVYEEYVNLQNKFNNAFKNGDNKQFEYAEQLQYMREEFNNANIDLQAIEQSFLKVKEASNTIAINQEVIDNFNGLSKAITETDTEKMQLFLNGLSNAEIENSVKSIGELENKIKTLQEAKDLAIKKGETQLADSLENDIKKSKELIELFKQDLVNRSQEIGNESGKATKDGIVSNVENAKNEAIAIWQEFNLKPKTAEIIVKYSIQGSPKGAYNSGSGGAVFDENDGLAYETLNRISNLGNNISNSISNFNVNQVNNFNVPVSKPSDVSKAIDKVNRALARRI